MNEIKDTTLIIVPSYLKDKVLKQANFTHELKNIKVMSFNSFLDNFLFCFDEKTIFHLMNEYSLKYDVALIYLNNLRFVEDKNYKSDKLNKLVKLKQYLKEKGLLKYNHLFKESLKRKKVIFYEIEENSFNRYIIEQLKKITDVDIKHNLYNNNYIHEIIEFNDYNDEIESVAERICELLNNGVNIENITLLNIGEDYLITLQRIFDLFKIPINIPNVNNILSTKMVTFFLDNLNSDIDITISFLKENFDLNNKNNVEIYNQIINVCNKYSWVEDYLLVRNLIVNDLKSIKINLQKIKNAVRIEKFDEYQPSDDDYVFLLGFNQGIIPKLERDEEYINDSIKNEVNLNTTVEKNTFHNKKSLNIIRNTKNMWISFIKHSKNGELQLSTLNNILNYRVIHNNKKYNYSKINNLLNLGKNLDNYLTYGTKSEELVKLYSNYSNIGYRTFNNTFKGINREFNDMTLSYSSIDNYYKCAFRYYVSSVLKLNIYEENFANYLGSLLHFVLSKKGELDLNTAWDLFLKANDRIFTNKELFFLNKGKVELEFILNTLEKFQDYTDFNEEIYETKIEVKKEDNVNFVGIIDKIMFNDNRSLAAIIDYKTGNPNLNLNNISYGLSMQLPVYLYLMNKKFPNIEVVGFYLQKVLPSLIVKDKVKSFEDQKKELLKLQGYSLSNEDKLSKFDKTYVDSSLIKSMKVGNNGFYAYSKTLTQKEMNEIIKLVDTKIDEAILNIKNNNFEINPKFIGKENIGCSFCKFRDICYMNNKDIVYLKEIKDLSFLGGDESA